MSNTELPSAVVLLSGGLDSATVAALAQAAGFSVYGLTVRYGQRHYLELEAASRVAKQLSMVEHKFVEIDLRTLGGSALTSELAVPKRSSAEQIAAEIPVTYVPARNTIFLSLALAWAEILGSEHLFVGVNALDYSGYPDCRPEFLAAFQSLARLATKCGVEGRPVTIHAPLINLSKSEIIRRGLELGVDYSVTLSCYDPDPDGLACGHCDACLLRLRGFQEVGQRDPARYL